jgi:hypothetical protein
MINYFGYGAMRNPTVIEAVLGRLPVGTPGSVSNMQLCIQRIDQVPSAAQDLLRTEWPDTFRSYTMIPAETGVVDGVVWEISEEEREIIRDWELVELGWFQVTDVLVTLEDGTTTKASTEILGEGQEIAIQAEGQNYPDLLNPLEENVRVARKSRREFLAKRGNPHPS